MTVKLYRHAWGAIGPNEPWPDLESFLQAATVDYDGVEMPLFVLEASASGAEPALTQMRELGLDYLPMAMTFPAEMMSPDAHLAELATQLESAVAAGATRVNAHAGVDAFDDDTARTFLADTVALAADLGIDLLHETHRSRVLYNPWRTARMVEQVEGLRLTADYSHWVCVAERLPFDASEVFATCAPAVGHIHARVGHAQGAQVGDPRDPMWAVELATHESWWDTIIAKATERGHDMTITPEFGPPPYMPTIPFTGEPVADLAEIVEWMRDRFETRYPD